MLALERKRARNVLTSTLAMILLAVVPFRSDSLVGPVLAPIILIAVGNGRVVLSTVRPRSDRRLRIGPVGTRRQQVHCSSKEEHSTCKYLQWAIASVKKC